MFNTRPQSVYMSLQKEYLVCAIPLTYIQNVHLKNQIDTSKQDT